MSIVVIGGGAAGMLAAIAAAENGLEVILIERNDRLGKKIFITGKGRCNITNNCPPGELMNNVVRNPRFLYSAFKAFDNTDIVRIINEEGIETKVERGERVFPVSDHSSDVIKALKNRLLHLNVTVLYNSMVSDLIIDNGECKGVCVDGNKKIFADAVILATGGCSYKTTGSDGNLFNLLKKYGHNVTKLRPSLVPYICDDAWTGEMAGLSLKNIGISLERDNKTVYSDFGEMLFTHTGVSGPVILSSSAHYEEGDRLYIDLKPALDLSKLDERLLRDFSQVQNKNFDNSLNDLLPKRLIPIIIGLSGIEEDKKVHQITSEERKKLCGLIKRMPVSIVNTAGFDEAIITRGGIDVKEVDPSTMRSKLINGLSFAGEMLDLDAYTGGYNLQIAWSTGYLAGARVLW